jgi:hypothetical protein
MHIEYREALFQQPADSIFFSRYDVVISVSVIYILCFIKIIGYMVSRHVYISESFLLV